jgi:hypothetical protein
MSASPIKANYFRFVSAISMTTQGMATGKNIAELASDPFTRQLWYNFKEVRKTRPDVFQRVMQCGSYDLPQSEVARCTRELDGYINQVSRMRQSPVPAVKSPYQRSRCSAFTGREDACTQAGCDYQFGEKESGRCVSVRGAESPRKSPCGRLGRKGKCDSPGGRMWGCYTTDSGLCRKRTVRASQIPALLDQAGITVVRSPRFGRGYTPGAYGTQ